MVDLKQKQIVDKMHQITLFLLNLLILHLISNTLSPTYKKWCPEKFIVFLNWRFLMNSKAPQNVFSGICISK